MNVLVTGGCGFIGCNLIQRLLEHETYRVRVVDNHCVGTLADLNRVCSASVLEASGPGASWSAPNVDVIQADIRDAKTATYAARDADVIVHLAASTGVAPSVANPRLDCDTNVIGTLNYLEAAREAQVRRFIFASSGAALGECEPPLHEEIAPHVVSPYGASKLAGEAYCSAYFGSFGIETVALRFSNVYGPMAGRKESLIHKFIRGALKGESLEVYGDGEQTRDFLYVDDLVEAILRAMHASKVGGEVFQIATSVETSVNEGVKFLKAAWKEAGIPVAHITHGARRCGDVRRNYADTSKARQRLGWEPLVDLEEGLRRTLKWFHGAEGHS